MAATDARRETVRADRPARRGPGDVALALAVLLASIMALGVALDRGISPLIPLTPGSTRGYGPLFYSYWVPLTWRTAEAVAAAWIALALTGGWRSPAGPTERVGRCLAWAWFGAYLRSGVIAVIVHG